MLFMIEPSLLTKNALYRLRDCRLSCTPWVGVVSVVAICDSLVATTATTRGKVCGWSTRELRNASVGPRYNGVSHALRFLHGSHPRFFSPIALSLTTVFGALRHRNYLTFRCL
jgi:hypothetical protein